MGEYSQDSTQPRSAGRNQSLHRDRSLASHPATGSRILPQATNPQGMSRGTRQSAAPVPYPFFAMLSNPSKASDSALGMTTRPPFSRTLSDTKLIARS